MTEQKDQEKEKQTAETANAPVAEKRVAKKGGILLVDDDKFLINMYGTKFSAEGYEVHSCLSTDDAVHVLQGGFPAIAIVFDLIMPEHDGFWFLQTLRTEKLAEKAVRIALTNESNDAVRQKVMELGADRLIVKASMIPSEVVNSVSEEISRRSKA